MSVDTFHHVDCDFYDEEADDYCQARFTHDASNSFGDEAGARRQLGQRGWRIRADGSLICPLHREERP
jgi:hypothetical protein